MSLQGNAVTINSSNQGAGVMLGTVKQLTFDGEPLVTNLSNPAWVAGTGSFFDVTYNRTTAPDSTVNLDIQFSQPLPASSSAAGETQGWKSRRESSATSAARNSRMKTPTHHEERPRVWLLPPQTEA